jgi:hypothetical protein
MKQHFDFQVWIQQRDTADTLNIDLDWLQLWQVDIEVHIHDI